MKNHRCNTCTFIMYCNPEGTHRDKLIVLLEMGLGCFERRIAIVYCINTCIIIAPEPAPIHVQTSSKGLDVRWSQGLFSCAGMTKSVGNAHHACATQDELS